MLGSLIFPAKNFTACHDSPNPGNVKNVFNDLGLYIILLG